MIELSTDHIAVMQHLQDCPDSEGGMSDECNFVDHGRIVAALRDLRQDGCITTWWDHDHGEVLCLTDWGQRRLQEHQGQPTPCATETDHNAATEATLVDEQAFHAALAALEAAEDALAAASMMYSGITKYWSNDQTIFELDGRIGHHSAPCILRWMSMDHARKVAAVERCRQMTTEPGR